MYFGPCQKSMMTKSNDFGKKFYHKCLKWSQIWLWIKCSTNPFVKSHLKIQMHAKAKFVSKLFDDKDHKWLKHYIQYLCYGKIKNVMFPKKQLLLKPGPKSWTRTLDPGTDKPWPRTWTRTPDPDPEKPGPRKMWTLKNMDPGKHGSWKISNQYGIKKLRKIYFIKAMRTVICCLKVHLEY